MENVLFGLALTARCQRGNVLFHAGLVQRVEEDQDQCQRHEACKRGQTRQIEDLGSDGGIEGGGLGVADHGQQAADEAGGDGLTQLTGEGVDGVHGAVLTHAVRTSVSSITSVIIAQTTVLK